LFRAATIPVPAAGQV